MESLRLLTVPFYSHAGRREVYILKTDMIPCNMHSIMLIMSHFGTDESPGTNSGYDKSLFARYNNRYLLVKDYVKHYLRMRTL